MKLKESVALTERLRAAEVRLGVVGPTDPSKCQVVEIDAKVKPVVKRVRMTDKNRYVEEVEEPLGGQAKRIPLKANVDNGVENAIHALQTERDQQFLEERRRLEMARLRRFV